MKKTRLNDYGKTDLNELREAIVETDSAFGLLMAGCRHPAIVDAALSIWRDGTDSEMFLDDELRERRERMSGRIRLMLKLLVCMAGGLLGICFATGYGSIPQSPILCFFLSSLSITCGCFVVLLDESEAARDILSRRGLKKEEASVSTGIKSEWDAMALYTKKKLIRCIDDMLGLEPELAAQGLGYRGVTGGVNMNHTGVREQNAKTSEYM